MDSSRSVAIRIILPLFLLGSLFFCLATGSVSLGAKDIASCLVLQCPDSLTETILWDIRLPRVFMAVLVGAGLALSGAMLQTCTRNPLADPYLFGIVSGAGLGATIVTTVLPADWQPLLPLFAFMGAMIAVVIVIALSRYLQRFEMILLCGVAIGFMFSAITQFLLYLGEPFAANRIIFWLMGSLANVAMSNVYWLAGALLVTCFVSLRFARHLDALMLDDDSAEALGVDTKKLRLMLLLLCALLTSVIVAWCGGIGFVGLMIPHIVRATWGTSGIKLVVGSMLVGGVFLLWVDFIARQALPNQEIPLGVITAALGSVFFVGIMIQRQIKSS